MTGRDRIKKFTPLQQERATLYNVFDLIDKFIVPAKGRLYTRNDENAIEWRYRERYDDTAVVAAQTLASSIFSAVTNPAHKWFEFRFKDDKLNSIKEAAEWLYNAEQTVWTAIKESNFNTEGSEFFVNDVSFGTALLTHLQQRGEFSFKNLDIKGALFTEDFFHRANGLFLEVEKTAEQLVQEFPINCPDEIRVQADSPDKSIIKHEVIHAIYPELDNFSNSTYKYLAPQNRPYQEVFVLKSDGTILNDTPSGYYEFPVYVLRWGQAAGSKFGYSPGQIALNTVLTLNQLIELILRSGEKAVDPPILTLDRGVIGDPDLRAGGRTNVRDMGAMAPFDSRARLDIGELQRQELVQSINRTFYIDQLQLKESPAMTATEVNVRYELMQRLIGPPVARIKTDFLDPLLSRSFFILYREGRIDPPPKILSDYGAQYDIEYIGAWSRSQKMDEVMAIEGALASIAQLASIDPEVLDGVDMAQAGRDLALLRGLPPKYLRTDKQIQQIQEQRAQQQQLQAMMEMLKTGASAMKDVSDSGMAEQGALAQGVPQ